MNQSDCREPQTHICYESCYVGLWTKRHLYNNIEKSRPHINLKCYRFPLGSGRNKKEKKIAVAIPLLVDFDKSPKSISSSASLNPHPTSLESLWKVQIFFSSHIESDRIATKDGFIKNRNQGHHHSAWLRCHCQRVLWYAIL